MKQASIDHGRSFDWGKASGAYAEYRDIYPPAFYEHLLARPSDCLPRHSGLHDARNACGVGRSAQKADGDVP